MAKPPEDDQAFLAASRLAAELSQKPQRGSLAFCIYFLLGLGVLAPWNAFITAVDYFGALFPGRHVDRLEAITYLPIMLVTLAAGIHIKVLNTASRIRFAFAGFTVALLAVPLLDAIAVRGGEAHHSMIYVVLALVCLAGFADGVGQGALYGEAALLPDWATQALTGGSAASGVLICALRALTKALLPQDTPGLRISASVYFLVSAALCILCLLLHTIVLPQLPVVRRNQLLASLACAPRLATVMDSSTSFASPQVPLLPGTPEAPGSPRPCHEPPPLRVMAAESGAEKGVCVGSMSDDTAMLGSLQAACVLELSASSCSSPAAPASAAADDPELASLNPDACHLSAPGCSRRPDAAAAASAAAGDDAVAGGWRRGRARPASTAAQEARRLLDGAAAASDAADGVAAAPRPAHVMRLEDGGGLEYMVVVRQIWRLAVAICLLYCVTLSIFPGVLAEDVSSQKLGDWYPLVLITLYNLADMLGKMLPPSAALLQQQRLQLLLSALRVVFVPAFAAAALSQRCPPAGMALLTFLLGLTNGYLTTAAMVAAPHALQPGHAEVGGNVMVLFLVLGLNIGAFSGWLWLL